MSFLQNTGRKMDAAWKKAISEGKKRSSVQGGAAVGYVGGALGSGLLAAKLVNKKLASNFAKLAVSAKRDTGLTRKRFDSMASRLGAASKNGTASNTKQLAEKATRIAKSLLAKQAALDHNVLATASKKAAIRASTLARKKSAIVLMAGSAGAAAGPAAGGYAIKKFKG